MPAVRAPPLERLRYKADLEPVLREGSYVGKHELSVFQETSVDKVTRKFRGRRSWTQVEKS